MSTPKIFTQYRLPKLLVAGIAALSIVALVTPTAPVAADDNDSSVVELDDSTAKSFYTTDGVQFEVVSDDAQAGERVVTATTAKGEPARIVFQNVPVDSLDTLLALPAPSQTDPGVVDVNPGPITESVQSTLIEDDPSLWTPSFAYAVTQTTASFKWDLSVGDFEVLVDGKKAGTSSDKLFELTDLAPSTKYIVNVIGNVTNNTGVVYPTQKTIELVTFATDPSAVESQLISPMTYQQYSTAFTHRTFIPEATVDAAFCNWGLPGYTFDGDNRSYSFPTIYDPNQTPNYRTMMWANVNWQNPAPYMVITVKNVGQSVTRHNGSVVQATYASMDQMLFQDVSSGGSYAQVRFNHTASNPHCKLFDANYGGSIQYNEIVRFYQSGTVEIVGWRKPVPAHEGYVRFNTSTGGEVWMSAFTRGNEGFHCLVDGLCAFDNINVTRSY